MTGALFDFMAYLYIENLADQGLIHRDLRDAVLDLDRRPEALETIHRLFESAYANRHFQFKAALMQARDAVGNRLTAAWEKLLPTDLTFSSVVTHLIDADFAISGARHQEQLREVFRWREIYEEPHPVKT